MAAYPDPPPVIPLPESLAAQGPYVRLSCPGLARARNVSRHWGPPGPATGPHVVKRGGPSGPKESHGQTEPSACAPCPDMNHLLERRQGLRVRVEQPKGAGGAATLGHPCASHCSTETPVCCASDCSAETPVPVAQQRRNTQGRGGRESGVREECAGERRVEERAGGRERERERERERDLLGGSTCVVFRFFILLQESVCVCKSAGVGAGAGARHAACIHGPHVPLRKLAAIYIYTYIHIYMCVCVYVYIYAYI